MLNPRVLLVLFGVTVTVLSGPAAPSLQLVAQARPGCTSRCGNLTIPYPFGTTDGQSDCYYGIGPPLYVIFCDNSSDPSIPYWSDNSSSLHPVIDISLENHELRIMTHVLAYECHSPSGNVSGTGSPSLELAIFPISSTKNRFTAVGCNTASVFSFKGQHNHEIRGGCLSFCNQITDVTNGSCSGVGCCQVSLPRGMMGFDISVGSYFNHSYVYNVSPCSFAFIAATDYFNFSMASLKNITEQSMPLVLDWQIGNQTCEATQNDTAIYMCKENTICANADSGKGYRCHCKIGYQGNPYLSGPDGCQDIDECETSKPCIGIGICTNLPGTYKCSCPVGYESDSWKVGCLRNEANKFTPHEIIVLVISSGAGAVLLFLVLWLYKFIKKRRELKLKQNNFKRNGGLLLENQLHSSSEGKYIEKSKLFNSYDLEKATDNFSKNRILGQGGQGTVYKGMLEDGRIVAVKRSTAMDSRRIEQFINEVIILSEINHRNVVKLYGCCLETEVPLLVYEFIPNGTLYQYLHDPDEDFSLSWEMRLRISVEVAGAVSYLHSASSSPIYHRDIKSNNILLDEKYQAKVADFGASKSLSIDQTHVTTVVAGTFGYLDPEYFRSSKLTDKSDVYSFGVVLVELLTGQKAISLQRSVHESLAEYFISVMEEGQLFDIVDARVLLQVQDTAGREQIAAVAQLAKRCLEMIGRRRPTMKEVAVELERIRLQGRQDGDVEYQRTESIVSSWDDSDFSTSSVNDGTLITSHVQPLLGAVTL